MAWRGDRIKAKIEAATKLGIDQTLAACVVEAKNNHPWNNVTGTAEGSIQMEPAEKNAAGVIQGRWGSYGVSYFVYLELGTSKMVAMPCLLPAADKLYPTLTDRIRDNFNA